MNSFFITFTLTTERHLLAVNNKKEIQGIDQRGFSNIVWTHQLNGITIVEFHFGFAVTFRVN
jgi:hypothetical protein